MCPVVGTAAAGESGVSWPVVDAAELSPAGQVAEGPGENVGADHQTTPQLPLVDHYEPHPGIPHRHPAEVAQGIPLYRNWSMPHIFSL